MPSIESLYQQKEKAVDKCSITSELSTKNIATDILEVKVEKLDEKMVSLKEAVEIDESETSGDPCSLLVVKIEDSQQNSGQPGGGSTSPEGQGDGASDAVGDPREDEKGTEKVTEKVENEKNEKNENGAVKSSGGKWNRIISKIYPDYNEARNKLLKAKISEILSKGCPKGDDDLSNKLGAMSLGGDKNGLTSKGPVQATYHQADMSPQYSPAYMHSPGHHGHLTSMSSPPHDSSLMASSIMNDIKSSSLSDPMHTWVSNGYYPVSPPNSSFQSEHSLSDADLSQIPPQSPDDGPQDIPTVMAQAMHLIVPGESMPTASNQDVVNQWNYPSMSSSHDSGINCSVGRTDYDVQTWPGVESPSPASFQGNPPSVSSVSDVDSVFGPSSPYNNSTMSPASASGGSAAQSPAPTPPSATQWLPPQTSTTVTSEKLMTITASANNNFGVVQVQQTTGSCSSPSQLFDEQQQIKHIEDYLKTPYMEPHQQQTNLPSFNSTFPVSHPCKAPSILARRPVSTSTAPYMRPPVPSPPKDYTNIGPSPHVQLPAAAEVLKKVHQPYFPTVEEVRYQTEATNNRSYGTHPRLQPVDQQQQHQQNAMRLTQEELQQRDCSDPYEGENLLQKLILEQRSGEAIAVIERMVQLGLSLDATNDLGQSSLLLAVINDMPMVVRYLVHYNADVLNGDKKGTYPIHYAASHGFTDVIRAICYSNRPVFLDSLDFNGKTPLMCAVEAHATHQTMYQDGEEVTRYVNNEMIAKILIESGAQPTKQDARSGKTALHYAIADVKKDMIGIILEGDEMVKVARIAMYDGNTPLHLAVALKCDQTAKCDIIKYLIHKGADISATNVEKEKPIVLVTEGHKEVKECLEQFSKTRRR